jgi:probable rRNA maturation factor
VLFRVLPTEFNFSPGEKRSLRSFARTLGVRVANRRAFTCVIADDAELRRLNNAFLGHDYATDVLSFPSHAGTSHATPGELGELIISADRAELQAAEFGHERFDELRILMLHGVLHLCGMDHEHDCGEMASAEQKWREELGLPVTLIARAGRPGGSAMSRARSAQ